MRVNAHNFPIQNSMIADSDNKATLVRGLGLVAAISVIIGNVIGTGVFLKARVMTCNVGSPQFVIFAWIAAGVLSLAGALTYAELTAMMPQAGGAYNFLRAGYGRVWSFLFGWTQILIARTGAQAAAAVGFTIFLNDLLGGNLKRTLFTTNIGAATFELTNLQLIAVALIAAVTLLNCATVALGGRVATVLTFVKIALVVLVGAGALLLVDGTFANFAQTATSATCEGVAANQRFGTGEYTFFAGFAAAMLGALWGYDGWDNLSFVAGEVKNPNRNIPLAIIGSTALVILLYVFVNAAYFYVLTPETVGSISKDSSVAREVAARFLGAGAITLMTAGLLASSLGTLHTSILAGARIPFALAQDNLFFRGVAKLSEKTRVPVRALVLQGVWASLLALSGSFDALTDYVVFGLWIFYALTTATIFVFRRKFPDLERPYRAFGYPIVPVLFLLVATWLLVTTLVNSPKNSLIGIGLILLGLPVYFYLTKTRDARGNS